MLHRHASPAVAGAYTSGAVLGGLASASALLVISGLLSPIPSDARGALGICLITLFGLHAIGVLGLDLPQRKYQIPRDTFTGSPARAALRFAAELGTGVRTYVTTPAPYALVVVLSLCLPGSLVGAVAAAGGAGLGFGVGRARIVAAQSFRRSIAIDHPRHWLSAASFVSIALSLGIAIDYIVR